MRTIPWQKNYKQLLQIIPYVLFVMCIMFGFFVYYGVRMQSDLNQMSYFGGAYGGGPGGGDTSSGAGGGGLIVFQYTPLPAIIISNGIVITPGVVFS